MNNLIIEKKEIDDRDSFMNSSIVLDSWTTLPNYLIETSSPRKDLCVIYFSSHGIYFPNNEATFRDRILSRNYFEWYKIRLSNADKHIFVRDNFKQWYFKGINKDIPDQDAMLAFLQKETLGYRRVVTIGSSAGGYAAILFGCQLNAFKIFSFSPRISLTSLLGQASMNRYPVLYLLRGSTQLKNTDLRQVVNIDSPNIVYFWPIHSPFDIQQHALLKDYSRLRVIGFNNDKHGVQCPIECLNVLMDYNDQKWKDICAKVHSPLAFSFKVLGPITFTKVYCRKLTRRLKKAIR